MPKKIKFLNFGQIIMTIMTFLVAYSTLKAFYLAELSITLGFTGSLPWITTLITAIWGGFSTAWSFFIVKEKAENLQNTPNIQDISLQDYLTVTKQASNNDVDAD